MDSLDNFDSKPQVTTPALQPLWAGVDALATISPKGVVASCNAPAPLLFGLTEQQFLGSSIHTLMTAEDAERERRHLAKYGFSGITRAGDMSYEVPGVHSSGGTVHLRLIIRKMCNGDDCYYLCVIREVNETATSSLAVSGPNAGNAPLAKIHPTNADRLTASVKDLGIINRRLTREVKERQEIATYFQQREVQLERLLDKERELSELRTRFVSMASHEFRTPLTTMLSSVEIMEMALPSPPPMVQKHTRRIRESIGYLRNVLDDFLQLGKLDVTGTDLHVGELDLPTLLRRLTEDLSLMSKAGQDVELVIGDTIGNTVHSTNALRIILTNLVTNSIKYSDVGSAIDIHVYRTDDVLTIEVIDEGIGIPQSERAYLFERFYRASNAENTKGTGLGLHIVQLYVVAMQGNVRVEYVKPRGTRMVVELPYRLSDKPG